MERSSTSSNAKRGRNEGKKASCATIQYSGPSFSDLPDNIMENIIVRLPIKTIFVCNCVCKTWNHLISDPEFAKLHFEQAQISLLLRSSSVTFLSRMLYVVEPEQADFHHKLDTCDHTYPNHKCRLCQVKLKLDTKLKLPLRNIEKVLSDNDGGEREQCMKLKMKDHKYGVVNSCNGYLCLSERFDNDPVIICNPITGEFINLPEARTVKIHEPHIPMLRHIACGFGFSPATNQYKVIRMFLNFIDGDVRVRHKLVAEVHTLGTNSWKDIGSFPLSKYKLFPTNLNGCLYWLSDRFVFLFDIEKEGFGSVSLPLLKTNDPCSNMGMGVLGGELIISEADANDVQFWAMKEFNGKKGWSKLLSINKFTSFQAWPRGSVQPLMYLNDGALLLFNSFSNALIYKDPRKLGFKYLKVRGMDAKLEAIPYIPSFVSLKDVLSGLDVQVLNVKSRCGELKLHNEDKSVSLVEEYQKSS